MALVPGSPGSYNPGGGGAYGTYPWFGFVLAPMAAGMGLKVTKAVAPLVKPAAGWAGRQFILKPIWKVQQGFVNPLTAWQTFDTIQTWSERAEMAIAIAQIVDGSSSQDLVQNGGPSAPLVQRGTSSDVLSLGKTLKTQSAHGFRSGKARTAGGKRRSRRCPPGYYWDRRLRRCRRKKSDIREYEWRLRNS
jgi:hypothetical protein